MTDFDARTTLARPDLAASALRDRFKADHYKDGQTLQVVQSTLPLFSAPRADGAMQSEALFGETITVVEQSPEGWSWGQSDQDDYVGYLPSDGLSSALSEPTHRVTSLRSFVYAETSIKRVPLTSLSFGSLVSVTGSDGIFSRLKQGGFLITQHLTPLDLISHDPCAFALLFLNTPYLWGGRSGFGLDCSGLVQLALQACGFPCPRDSDMQERELGEKLADDTDLRRNDLIFWKGHVGLMLDETTLLHASGHHMLVVKEPLAEARARILAKTGHDITSCKRIAL
jgi:cell wall-associated NlpC family hydrolase